MDFTQLKYGELAPEFYLQAADGQTYTRNQFRGKCALVLLFVESTSEAYDDLLWGVVRDSAEYTELNAKVFAIVHTSLEEIQKAAEWQKLPFITQLADPDGVAWKSYTGSENIGYGIFVLDLYGGVESQQVADTVAELPATPKIVEWVRGAQYRCNI